MSVLISVIVRNVQLIAGQCHRSIPNEAASHQALYSGQRQSAVPISGLLPTSCMWLNWQALAVFRSWDVMRKKGAGLDRLMFGRAKLKLGHLVCAEPYFVISS